VPDKNTYLLTFLLTYKTVIKLLTPAKCMYIMYSTSTDMYEVPDAVPTIHAVSSHV